MLSKYETQKLIYRTEHTVDKDLFLKAMQSYFVTFPGQLDLLDTRARLDTGRGLCLEMITYYYLNQKYSDHAKVDWNYAVGRVQIDVIVKTKNTLIFIECKHTDKIIDEAKELIPSVSNICKLPQFKKDWEAEGHLRKKLIMSVWKKPSNKVLKELKKLNVGVLIMSEIFNKQFSNKNQDKKLNHLFERNPNAPDDFEDDDIDWDSVPFA